jgi:arylsulfatase A-like enzyme
MMPKLAGPWFLACVRLLNAVFFVSTAIYAVLTFSPFAYEQFIQPNLIAWLANFVFLHADFYWLALCLTLLTLAPYLAAPRARRAAWLYLLAASVGGVLLWFLPVLPGGHQPVRSIAVALLATAPLFWMAAIDRLTAPAARTSPIPAPALLASCLVVAIVVWAIFAVAAPVRLRAAGGLVGAHPGRQMATGIVVAAISHVTVATVVFLVLSIVGPAAPVIAAAAVGVLIQRVVLAPISVTGPASWAIALALAASLTMLVSGVGRHFARERLERGGARRTVPLIALVALPAAAYAALAIVTAFDWGFMLQKLTAAAVAVIAFAAVRALFAGRPWGGAGRRERLTIVVPGLVLIAYAVTVVAIPRISFSDFALDAYAAADPSFRLARQILDPAPARSTDAGFYASLRANTSLAGPVSPVDVDFVKPLSSPVGRPPHIFLFVIDSLRRDYVSPYNGAVTFTPRIGAFARNSLVFERAFSRYGGTGLAVPSIWSGAMVAHKQYVTPFAPMNALGKLLDAGGYRRIVSRDHITDELFGFPDGTTLLDEHVPEMMHTFCGTMEELKQDLRASRADRRPIFAHTRPLDLHIGNTRFAKVPPGETYPGFFEPYAARVRRIDSCFGDFVDELQRAGLYEDSVIILMADHGDSLGEGLRWGHGYTVVPEVLRIPLIVHLPSALARRFVADPTRVSFATDVTPTLYALLGFAPRRPRAVAGVPLVAPAMAQLASRRREAYVVASSYGAVYGLIRHNGRRLYIADAVEGRDYLYDLSPAGGDARIGMTDSDRSTDRALILEQVADIAAWYGVTSR